MGSTKRDGVILMREVRDIRTSIHNIQNIEATTMV